MKNPTNDAFFNSTLFRCGEKYDFFFLYLSLLIWSSLAHGFFFNFNVNVHFPEYLIFHLIHNDLHNSLENKINSIFSLKQKKKRQKLQSYSRFAHAAFNGHEREYCCRKKASKYQRGS